ncbi:MAG: PD40 domain-containing protein, partial [Flavobacteriales bacterium]|nr:PD40 domain-containing protein [Flavobacteriales bacterium]
RTAIPFLERAAVFNPNYSVLNYQLGKCYMASNQKFKAVDLLEKAYKANPSVDKEINFFLGWAYHVKNNWEKARYHYDLYKKSLNSQTDAINIEMVNKKIFECNNGEKLEKNPIRVWVDNLGSAINTEFPEYSPLITADESTIIFTSRRSDTYKGGIDQNDGQYFEDIYIARKNEKGQWDKAQNIGSSINTDNHDAPSGLSPDGKKLFVFYGWKGSGDIYESTFENNTYSKPVKLSNDISGKDSYESSAAISFDGKELYFASTRSGGLGEEDIYMSKWDEKKKNWGVPVNLGSTINTKYRETGIFLHPDGETMYFASEGHESMGGFDIFMSKRVNGVWTKPVNIGYPINSSDDDIFFVMSGSGRYAYYTSFREDGFGEKDLYRITFLGPEKQPMMSGEDNLLVNAKPAREFNLEPKVEVTSSSVIILKGVIRDEKTKQPLASTIELVDNEKNEIVATFSSDAVTGKYMVTIPGGTNYGIAVNAEGYLFHSENIFIPKSSGYREYQKDIDLKRIEVGQAIVLRNIFYDFDKATLRSESTTELERLVALMKENPT